MEIGDTVNYVLKPDGRHCQVTGRWISDVKNKAIVSAIHEDGSINADLIVAGQPVALLTNVQCGEAPGQYKLRSLQ